MLDMCKAAAIGDRVLKKVKKDKTEKTQKDREAEESDDDEDEGADVQTFIQGRCSAGLASTHPPETPDPVAHGLVFEEGEQRRVALRRISVSVGSVSE